jgi:uncharacterized membrane protein YgcG
MRVRSRLCHVSIASSAALVIVLGSACGAKHPPLGPDDGTVVLASMTRGPACDRSDQDTSRFMHLPLYRACAVSVKARVVTNDVRPEFRPSARDRSCYSATIDVAVDTAGRPEIRTARVVRTTDPMYGHAVLAILPALRFEPARLGGRPVRQLHQLREVLVVRAGGRWIEGGTGGRIAVSGSRTGTFMGGGGGGAAGAVPGSQPGSQLPTTSGPLPIC